MSVPRRIRAAAVAAVAPCLVLLSSCSSPSGSGAVTARPSATVAPTPTATLTVPTREVSFPADTGAMLTGTVYGDGSTAIVFANQTDSYQDQWGPLARTVAARGYLALTFEYEGQHGSEGERLRGAYDKNVVSAVAYARSLGARRIVLVGASIGGLAVAVAAPQARAEAVVIVSAPRSWTTFATSDDYLRALTMPKLFLESDLDQDLADIQYMYDHTAQPKDIHIYSGRTHGVAFFSSADRDDFTRRIMAFITTNAPA